MSAPVLSVQGLGKQYRLGGAHSHDTLRDTITHGASAIFRRLSGQDRQDAAGEDPGTFWALKDVSFEVQQGEVVGIVGRNGAGKSTLLKILSRITEPTTGCIQIEGRVASLLEVGTGFHPELTGRENVFLNGAILGMSRLEIKRKFDEIVAFAEIEKFLDTPVKRYSSGMYVRLAFAVAAHLEPEILIVDEVLAVGDAEFQKKCLGKMQDVAARGGRTVLFVSHNMAAVRRLCTCGIVLDKGRVATSGDIETVTKAYLMGRNQFSESLRQEFEVRSGRTLPAFSNIEIRNMAGEPCGTILSGEPFEIVLTLINPLDRTFPVVVGVEVRDDMDTSLFTSHSDDVSKQLAELPPGSSTLSCMFNTNPLMPGTYYLCLGMVDRHWSPVDWVTVDLPLRIDEVPHSGDGMHMRRPGKLALEIPWRFH